MFETNYTTMGNYLKQEGINKHELFKRAKDNKLSLLLYLEKVEGRIVGGGEKTEVTGLCKLTPFYCENLNLDNKSDILLSSSLELIEGEYKKTGNSWERIKIIEENKIIFQPDLYGNKEQAINPRYEVVPYAKSQYGKEFKVVYCYAISIERILVLDNPKKIKNLIRTLTIKQLLERWPQYSLENIYEFADQGLFGLYFKSYIKIKSYHDVKKHIDCMLEGPAEPLNDSIETMTEHFSYLNLRDCYSELVESFHENFCASGANFFLLEDKVGFERLATALEVNLYSGCKNGSIGELIKNGKILPVDYNNNFGFVICDNKCISRSYYKNVPFINEAINECFVFLDQIENFEKNEIYEYYKNKKNIIKVDEKIIVPKRPSINDLLNRNLPNATAYHREILEEVLRVLNNKTEKEINAARQNLESMYRNYIVSEKYKRSPDYQKSEDLNRVNFYSVKEAIKENSKLYPDINFTEIEYLAVFALLQISKSLETYDREKAPYQTQNRNAAHLTVIEILRLKKEKKQIGLLVASEIASKLINLSLLGTDSIVPILSDENLKNLEVGKKIRSRNKSLGLKSGRERTEEAAINWEIPLTMALKLVKEKPKSYTATDVANIIKNQLDGKNIVPIKIKLGTFRRKIGKDKEISNFLKPVTKRKN